jgi:hypothetical protein
MLGETSYNAKQLGGKLGWNAQPNNAAAVGSVSCHGPKQLIMARQERTSFANQCPAYLCRLHSRAAAHE